MKALAGAAASFHLLWQGELPLSEAFWTWAVVGGIAVNMAAAVLFVILLLADQPFIGFLAGHGFSLPYNIAVTVGVWQAAGRYPGSRHLAALARFATVAGMALLSIA